MGNELRFEEWKIKSIWGDYDRVCNKIKRAEIGARAVAADIPLYDNDLILLQKILGCNEDKLAGKDIIAVIKNRLVKAIGYQGLYIPLYFYDGNSRIMCESELCEYLECNEVVRINKDDEEIIRYEVPENIFSDKNNDVFRRKI